MGKWKVLSMVSWGTWPVPGGLSAQRLKKIVITHYVNF